MAPAKVSGGAWGVIDLPILAHGAFRALAADVDRFEQEDGGGSVSLGQMKDYHRP